MWEPRDYIILILVLCLVIFITGVFISVVFYQNVDNEKAAYITEILVAILAIISVYIGSKLK